MPWTRSGILTIQQQTNIEALKDLRTGEIIPIHNKGNILRFITKDIPSTGYKNEQFLISPNEEFRSLLKATILSGKPGNLPASKTGITLSRKRVLVTSFGPNVFGEGTVLRLWEQSGDAGKCKISLPEGVSFSKAVPINLRGENTGNAITIKDNSFVIEIEAYKPASFLIEM